MSYWLGSMVSIFLVEWISYELKWPFECCLNDSIFYGCLGKWMLKRQRKHFKGQRNEQFTDIGTSAQGTLRSMIYGKVSSNEYLRLGKVSPKSYTLKCAVPAQFLSSFSKPLNPKGCILYRIQLDNFTDYTAIILIHTRNMIPRHTHCIQG